MAKITEELNVMGIFASPASNNGEKVSLHRNIENSSLWHLVACAKMAIGL